MKAFIYILILSFFITCNDDGGYRDSLDNTVVFGLIMHYFMNLDPTSVVDMKNGTVRVSFNGDSYVFYKKCLQGQVYREEENDCKGTGSETDFYGAVQLQYCDTADNSCDSGYYLDGSGNSEAYNSCDSDYTLGLRWKVLRYFSEKIFKSKTGKNIYYYMFNTELKVWEASSESDKLAQCTDFPNVTNCEDTKTNSNYVLCRSSESYEF